jgi:hypothetical protein
MAETYGLLRWTATALKIPACVTMFSFLFNIVFKFSVFVLVYLPPSLLSLFIFIVFFSFFYYFFFAKVNEIVPPMNLPAFVCLFTWACFPLGWSMATCSGWREHGVGQGVKLLLNCYKSVHKVPFGVSLWEPSSVQFRKDYFTLTFMVWSRFISKEAVLYLFLGEF